MTPWYTFLAGSVLAVAVAIAWTSHWSRRYWIREGWLLREAELETNDVGECPL